jgi:hypothetical protein
LWSRSRRSSAPWTSSPRPRPPTHNACPTPTTVEQSYCVTGALAFPSGASSLLPAGLRRPRGSGARSSRDRGTGERRRRGLTAKAESPARLRGPRERVRPSCHRALPRQAGDSRGAAGSQAQAGALDTAPDIVRTYHRNTHAPQGLDRESPTGTGAAASRQACACRRVSCTQGRQSYGGKICWPGRST